MKRLVVALLALAALVSACSSSGTAKKASAKPPVSNPGSTSAAAGGGVKGSITVFAAASLTGAFGTIKTAFEQKYPGTKVALHFGASSDLATQINQGQRADVFASAAPKNMQAVVSKGNAGASTNFVSNSMEVAVPPNNPAKITKVQDLAKSGVKVALCQPQVPCGTVAAEVFTKAKITVKASASEPDVKHTLAVVESKEVDAGCVYVTDVLAAGNKVRGIPVPADLNATTEYPIAPLSHSTNGATAAAFVSFVTSPAGRAILLKAGFKAP